MQLYVEIKYTIMALIIILYSATISLGAEIYKPMQSKFELWASTKYKSGSIINEYVMSYQEDTGRKNNIGDAIIDTRMVVYEGENFFDFGYLAQLQGSFDDFLGDNNKYVKPEIFDQGLTAFFGHNGSEWNRLGTYFFWTYRKGAHEPNIDLLAFTKGWTQDSVGSELVLCDTHESSKDAVQISVFSTPGAGCGRYQLVNMLDKQLASMTPIAAVSRYSVEQERLALVAGEIGFQGGKLIVEAMRRPQRRRYRGGEFRGWNTWLQTTQGRDQMLGPSIVCRIPGDEIERFADLKPGSLFFFSGKLVEISGERFILDCT